MLAFEFGVAAQIHDHLSRTHVNSRICILLFCAIRISTVLVGGGWFIGGPFQRAMVAA